MYRAIPTIEPDVCPKSAYFAFVAEITGTYLDKMYSSQVALISDPLLQCKQWNIKHFSDSMSGGELNT